MRHFGFIALLVPVLGSGVCVADEPQPALERDLAPQRMLEYSYRFNTMMCELHRNVIVPKGPAKKVTMRFNGAKNGLVCEFNQAGLLIKFGSTQRQMFAFAYADLGADHALEKAAGKAQEKAGKHAESDDHAHAHEKNHGDVPTGATSKLVLTPFGAQHADEYFYTGDGQTTLGKFSGMHFESDLHRLELNSALQLQRLVLKKTDVTYTQTWDGDALMAIDRHQDQVVRELSLSGHQFDEHGNLTRYSVKRHAESGREEKTATVALQWEYY